MSLPVTENIYVIQGAGAAGTITVKLNGVAQDITGWTGVYMIKENLADADVDGTEIDLVIQDAEAGIFSFAIDSASSAGLPARECYGEFHLQPVDDGAPIKIQNKCIVGRRRRNA